MNVLRQIQEPKPYRHLLRGAVLGLLMIIALSQGARAQVAATVEVDAKLRAMHVPAGAYTDITAGTVVTITDFLTDGIVTAYVKVRWGEKEGYLLGIDVRPKRVIVGMRAEMVRRMWGFPHRINRTTTQNGTSEQWVYGDGVYVYVEDAVVTALQN